MKPHKHITTSTATTALTALAIAAATAAALLGGSGCCSTGRHEKQQPPPAGAATVAVPVSGTELDLSNMTKVRLGETLKAYPVNRYVDPNDPNMLHEAHLVYRKETGASWNLSPHAPTVVPLGPTLAVSAPADNPAPTSADIEQRVQSQIRLMSALTEQNETLVAEIARLQRELSNTRAAPGATARTNNGAMQFPPATTQPTTTTAQ